MNLTRIVLAGLGCAALAAAQAGQGNTLAALSEKAQQAEASWIELAKDMDLRVARMLPCDARATAAIEAARTASDTRLSTLAAYLDGAVTDAGLGADGARALISTRQEALTGVSIERTDIEQERAGVESQVLNMTASLEQKAALSPALEQLKSIEKMIQGRAAKAAAEASSGDQVLMLLNNLVTAFEGRQQALQKEAAAFAAERSYWNAYYQDRLARARLECSITGGGR